MVVQLTHIATELAVKKLASTSLVGAIDSIQAEP